MNKVIIVTKNYTNGRVSTAPTITGIKWSVETRIKIAAGHILNGLNNHRFSWKLYEDGALKEVDYYPIMTSDRCLIYKSVTNELVYAIVPAVVNLCMLDAVDSKFSKQKG